MVIDFERMLKEIYHGMDAEINENPPSSTIEEAIYYAILGLSVSVIAGLFYLFWIIWERNQIYPA